MQRRSFLQRLAATGIVLQSMTMGFPKVRAFAASPKGSPFANLASANRDRIFVIIRLAGGNDGLNTVVPYTNSLYYEARKEGEVSIAADKVVKLPDSQTLGLHPSLKPLLDLYNEKKMTIVQNVAYPDQNLSHFRSTDIWLSGSDASVFDNSGWYGKFLEQQYPDYPAKLPTEPFAIELGMYLGTTCVGENNPMGVPVTSLDYIPGTPDADPVAATHAGDEETYVREVMRQSNIFSNAILNAGYKQQTNKVTYPTTELGRGLASIARVIAGGLDTQMYIVNVGGYDTHSDELTNQANLHEAFANAVVAFQRDLEAFGLDKRVCFMTISEFGRRPKSNGTGTDHGSAAPMFVFGAGVRSGVIGNNPDFVNLDSNQNLKMQYDFRQIYASVLGQWYGASEAEISPKALPRKFEQLPIFNVSTATSVHTSAEVASTLSIGQSYPNPASTVAYIPVGGILNGTPAQLSLYTQDGRAVGGQEVMSGQTTVLLATDNLPSGKYTVILESAGIRKMSSLTVMR